MSDGKKILEGGCACDTVRYRMESAPLIVHCCHCHYCQRASGASFALNALIEADRVTLLEGEPDDVMTPTRSGKGQNVVRCPNCRVAVWSNYAGMGDKVRFVRVGSLDQGHGLAPDIHIFTNYKQPWVVIPDGHASVGEYYDMKEVWRTESLARFKTLRDSG